MELLVVIKISFPENRLIVYFDFRCSRMTGTRRFNKNIIIIRTLDMHFSCYWKTNVNQRSRCVYLNSICI